jgi:hypothetical protein
LRISSSTAEALIGRTARGNVTTTISSGHTIAIVIAFSAIQVCPAAAPGFPKRSRVAVTVDEIGFH